MKLIAVHTDPSGQRFELALDIPDDYAPALETDNARDRLQILLNREVERAGTVVFVAAKDRRERIAAPKPRRAGKAGPDQIAFAGSTKKAVAVRPPRSGRARR